MKNKFEDYCYVCGKVVPEGEGVAEMRLRNPGESGFGKTKWSVRCKTCKQPSGNSETQQ